MSKFKTIYLVKRVKIDTGTHWNCPGYILLLETSSEQIQNFLPGEKSKEFDIEAHWNCPGYIPLLRAPVPPTKSAKKIIFILYFFLSYIHLPWFLY